MYVPYPIGELSIASWQITAMVGPLLDQITTDDLNDSLLYIERGHQAVADLAHVLEYGNITKVTDKYHRVVLYHTGTYGNTNTNSTYPQFFQELDHVSTVIDSYAATCSPDGQFPDKYVYGYKNIANGDGMETVPFLHTISSPSPGNLPGGQAFMKTLTVNYNVSTCTVSSVVDGNGNQRCYAVGSDSNKTVVALKDSAGSTVYSHTVGFNSRLNMVSDTDGAGHTVYAAEYGDTDDPLQPSSVTDGLGREWTYD